MGEDYRMKFEKYKKDKSKLESFRPKNPFDSRQICEPDISGRPYIDEKTLWLEENMERRTDEANEIVAKLKERFKDD
jgi:hypothetical protein